MKKINLTKLTWKVGGEAGFGIKAAGLSFSRVCAAAGYETFDYVEYPSLVRGGHNTYQVTVSNAPVRSVENRIDVLVALNEETIDKHFNELKEKAAIIYDGDKIKLSGNKFKEKKINLVSVPLEKITQESGGNPLMRNTVALGVSVALIGLNTDILEKIIKNIFKKKPSVVKNNIAVMKKGYKHVKDNYQGVRFELSPSAHERDPRMMISGNEAVAVGALAAGANFFVAYPMTPSTPILHYLAQHAVKHGMIVKQAEDEISVINMALGASFAGARTMCATSGGGFALMNEALGLCGITETPLVIVNVQRPGPATGLPTWTDQGDLQFVLHSAQGEFPRIVLAPGDVEECFYLTTQAFNLSEKYQLPVIILSDKFLGEGSGATDVFDENEIKVERGKILSEKRIPKDYKRYKLTPDGVSPRSLPGMKGGIYLANSDEHDEYGFSCEEADNRVAQADKRAKKLETAAKEISGAYLYGKFKAKITIVAWGSTKGPILDALAMLPKKDRKKFNLLHLNIVWPFPTRQMHRVLSKAKITVLVENNQSGQLGQLIRQETGIEVKKKILKYDGRPFWPDELAQELLKLTK